MADLFSALADPTRRGILEELRDAGGEVTVPALVEATGAARQAVNRHLLVLLEAELVVEHGDGPTRTYEIAPAPLLGLEDWIASFLLGVPEDVGLGEPVDRAGTAADTDAAGSGDGDGDWLWPAGRIGERAFAAWAGSEVGSSLGRRAADVRHAVDAARRRIARH